MNIIERARASGKYPPSLLKDSSNGDEEFETAVMKVLDANGTSVLRKVSRYHLPGVLQSSPIFLASELCLATGPAVPEDFKTVLQVRGNLCCNENSGRAVETIGPDR